MPRTNQHAPWVALAGTLLALGPGCLPTLDECTEEDLASFENGENLYFDRGAPMFNAQHMVQTSCGNGAFCHSPAATGRDRFGAPAGFDFDVSLACNTDDRCEDEVSFQRIDRASRTLFRNRRRIMDSVRSGTMPPGGGKGEDYRELTGQTMLRIDEPGAKDVLEKWLACGTPLVETTVEPGAAGAAGDPCLGEPGRTGFCFVRDEVVVPEANWDSIYTLVIEPECKGCHQEEGGVPGFYARSELDLSDADRAYSELVGAGVLGERCAGNFLGLRVVTDPMLDILEMSLLWKKLEGTTECGDPMPPSGILPEATLAPIREWLLMGAPRN